MWAMIVKEFRQLKRDSRTLAMLVALPVLLLVVFGYAARFDVSNIAVDVVGPHAEQVAGLLRAPFHVVEVQPGAGKPFVVAQLHDGDAAVGLVTGQRPLLVLMDGTQLFAAQAAEARLCAHGCDRGGGRLAGECGRDSDPVQPEAQDLVDHDPGSDGPDPFVHRHSDHEPRHRAGAAVGDDRAARGHAVPALGRHLRQDRSLPAAGFFGPLGDRRRGQGAVRRAVRRQRGHLRPRRASSSCWSHSAWGS